MKRIISTIVIVLVSLILALTASAKGEIRTEARSSSMNFTKIDVAGCVRLIVEERTTGNIVIMGDDELIRHLDITVQKNTLYASLRNVTIGREMHLEIRIPNNGRISEIEADGASYVKVYPMLKGNEIELEADGASKIEANMNATLAKTSCSGASKIISDIQARRVEMECEGASKTVVTGNADSVEIDVEGASKVDATALVCTRAKVEAEGASKALVNCSATMDAKASGASKVIYRGECKVTSVTDFTSKVTKEE